MLEGTDTLGRFEFRPLEPGYGTTIGNALRRILLASLEGFAISSIKISGVNQEFDTIPGVIESVDADTLYRGQTWRQMTGKNGTTSLSEMASKYKDGLARDGSNWGNVEVCHASPHADPEHYSSLANVALSYPFNCIHTVAGSDPAANFRNASTATTRATWTTPAAP